MKKRNRVAVALALAATVGACHKAADEQTETSAAVPVEVAEAHIDTVRAVVATRGPVIFWPSGRRHPWAWGMALCPR